MRNKCCAVIVEPPMCFPWGLDEEDERCAALKLLIMNRLSCMQAKGVTRFYIPPDAGIGLYASELIVSLMETNKEICLYSLIPYEEQVVKWSPILRNRYYTLQEQYTEPILISRERTSTCELDAMLEAIDRADYVLAISARDQPQDQSYATALRYAQKSGCEIQYVTLPEFH